jgi:Mg2+-importing ATPase
LLRAGDGEKLWLLSLAEILSRLDSGPDGLSPVEAAARLKTYGRNVLEGRSRRNILLDFLARFRNPLVLILLAAAAVSAATQQTAEFFIIISIVVLSVILDFVQERRAENAAESLRARVAIMATVRRDGVTRELPVAQLVPGDVILLTAGDLVPADCRLIETDDLFVNESLLTGESFPAEKEARDTLTEEERAAAVPPNAVFMGSSVVGGSAKAVAVATGRTTQFARIAGAIQRPRPPTAFALGIRDFGNLIVRVTVLLVLFTLLVNILFARPLIESFLFALALAVGLTPELLPMVVSVTLAHGAVRMSRRGVIVKRLSAIHDLGSMDVLCSDKTGTLTQARIKLVRTVGLDGAESVRALELAYINAAFETGLKSPLDEAILQAAPADSTAWRKIDEVPFDFERRRVSVLVEREERRTLIVKGAPEDVMRLTAAYETGAGTRPFDAEAQRRAKELTDRLAGEGYRLLGVAWKEVPPARDHAGIGDEVDLTLAGFAVFHDPPKVDARAAILDLAGLGVSIKIVTGDNERVTEHVCRELGIEVTGTLTGTAVAATSDEALSARLDEVNLYCRMTPVLKVRVIDALRRRGHIVGYLGDGINDAPSLQRADVGLSVDGAVDVAKDAAAMILLRHDLGVLADGVREGRRTFANVMKYMMMATSSNFGNMFSMAGGVLFLPFLPMLPVQILLNNLLYDFSEAAIPLDRVDAAMVARPQRWNMRRLTRFMLIFGPISSVFDLLTFGLLLWIFHANEALFQTGWFVESLLTQVLVIFVIRTRGAAWKSLPHPVLLATSLLVVCLALLLPFTPLGDLVGLVPLPVRMLLLIAGLTVVYLVVVEATKRGFYARITTEGV